MTEKPEEERSIEPEKIFEIIDNTEEKLNRLHKEFSEKTQDVGFALDTLRSLRETYLPLCNSVEDYQELGLIMTSGYNNLQAINNELGTIYSAVRVPFGQIRMVAQSVYTACATASSVAGTINPEYSHMPEYPAYLNQDKAVVTQNLTVLDPSLSDTYEEIEQTYYGTTSDNVRASMSIARQTFDHFFDRLAPDDEVKKTEAWRIRFEKTGDDKVTREDRVNYAIQAHVKNPQRQTTLINSVDNVIKSYKVLNKLHTRGQINNESCKQAIFVVKKFIEDFAFSFNE
ncbi:MAG: hypothetical protein GX491_07130 [Chloroflexi bacterium]|nr:hypothetical protein [Chloroflexota bacterium]